MPFISRSQQRWMYANHPEMAKRWAEHTPNMKSLPEKKTEHATLDVTGGEKMSHEKVAKEVLNTLVKVAAVRVVTDVVGHTIKKSEGTVRDAWAKVKDNLDKKASLDDALAAGFPELSPQARGIAAVTLVKAAMQFHAPVEKKAEKPRRDDTHPRAKDLIETDSPWGAIGDYIAPTMNRRAGRVENAAQMLGKDTSMATHHPQTSLLLNTLGGFGLGGLGGAALGGAAGLGLGVATGHDLADSAFAGSVAGAGLGGGAGMIGGILNSGDARRNDRHAVQKALSDALNSGQELTPHEPNMDGSFLSPLGARHRAGQADMYQAMATGGRLPPPIGTHTGDTLLHNALPMMAGPASLPAAAALGIGRDFMTSRRINGISNKLHG